MINVSIPVEKHVRKYLIRKYGLVHRASKITFIGKLVLQALTDKAEKPKPGKVIPPTHKYDIEVPELYFNTKGHTMAPNAKQLLGDCFNILFDEEMCSHLDRQVMDGKKALPELKLFMAMYNICEDDVKVESLYKVYQRHKVRAHLLKKNVA